MRVVMVADAEQKEEMLTQIGALPAEVDWTAELGAMDGMTSADACIDLLYDGTAERFRQLKEWSPGLIIINSVSSPLNESTPGCIRINGWNTFLKRTLIEAAGDQGREKAEAVFSLFGKKVDWVPDIPGFISARVVATVINEAWFALEEKISTKEEIDIAMKLGTNYPYGPFEWSEKIGLKNIYDLLKRLGREQERYEPAKLLAREANS